LQPSLQSIDTIAQYFPLSELITRRLLGFLKTFNSLQRHQRIEGIFAEMTSKMYPFVVVDGWQ